MHKNTVYLNIVVFIVSVILPINFAFAALDINVDPTQIVKDVERSVRVYWTIPNGFTECTIKKNMVVWESPTSSGERIEFITDTTAYLLECTDPDGNYIDVSAGITAKPADTIYTITVVQELTKGVIRVQGDTTPANTVRAPAGTDSVFIITPNAGYHISGLRIDGVPQAAISPYTFSSVTSDHTLEAVFAANPTIPPGDGNPPVGPGSGVTNAAIGKITSNIISPLIFLLVGVAVVVFLWGAVEFLAHADNSEGRETGKRHLIWGIVGLFIIASVFGIMNLIQNTLVELFR